MKLEHKFTVPAPVEEAWAAFNDLERVVPCFPGATLTSFDGDEFVGSCKVKLGPVSLLYTGTGQFAERDPAAHRAVIVAKGKDRRGNGTAAATMTAQLTASGPASTDVTVDTDLTVTGKPAQFGRGLMQEVSDKLLNQFADCLTKGLGPTKTTTAGTTAAESEPATSSASASETAASETAASETESASGGAAGEVTLDLGSALMPALARRVAPYVIGAVLALFLRRLLRR